MTMRTVWHVKVTHEEGNAVHQPTYIIDNEANVLASIALTWRKMPEAIRVEKGRRSIRVFESNTNKLVLAAVETFLIQEPEHL